MTCYSLTPQMLKTRKLHNRAYSIIRRNVNISKNELVRIKRRMVEFPFLENKCFEYVSSKVYLTIFYRNRHYDDYIVIYLS